MKNSTELASHWDEIKEKFRQQFSTLTDEDLLMENGNQDELLCKLEAKLGMPKQEIYDMIFQIEK
ncbi:MAG: general stress protein CsbD [Arcicella sp.]|nr:general stress protein CsbD [Arcicella sp.]